MRLYRVNPCQQRFVTASSGGLALVVVAHAQGVENRGGIDGARP